MGVDSENRVIQKCFDDPSGYQMYHTCDTRDFCNINVFSMIKVVNNASNPVMLQQQPETVGDNSNNNMSDSNSTDSMPPSTSKDTIFYLLTTTRPQAINNAAPVSTSTLAGVTTTPALATLAPSLTTATTSVETSSVATKQYYYLDMTGAYSTTRNYGGYGGGNGCGGSNYYTPVPTVTTQAPCQSSASSIIVSINRILSILLFSTFTYLISF